MVALVKPDTGSEHVAKGVHAVAGGDGAPTGQRDPNRAVSLAFGDQVAMQEHGLPVGAGAGGGCGDTGGKGAGDLQAFFSHSCFSSVRRRGRPGAVDRLCDVMR